MHITRVSLLVLFGLTSIVPSAPATRTTAAQAHRPNCVSPIGGQASRSAIINFEPDRWPMGDPRDIYFETPPLAGPLP